MGLSRQQAAGSRQQAAGSRQQAAGSRQQAAGSRQQAAGSRQQAAGRGRTPHLVVLASRSNCDAVMLSNDMIAVTKEIEGIGVPKIDLGRLFIDGLACTYGCYQKFASHWQGFRRGGGVMCLVNSDYCASELPKSTKFPESCDTLIIKLSAIVSVIIAFLRPPAWSGADTLNLLETIENALAAYVSQGYHAIVLGDLNFPDINWLVDSAVVTNVYSSALVELSIAWDMTQIVSEHTRENSFLDTIITTTPSVFSDCRLLPPVGKSDHDIVVCSLNLPPQACQNGNKLSKHINCDTLQQRLSAIN